MSQRRKKVGAAVMKI